MTVIRCLPLLGLASVASLALAGCGNPFDPANLVESVRLLAISADKPYPAPGDTVNMDALAFDGRPAAMQLAPMKVFWVPLPCPDPPDGSYFACYFGLEEDKQIKPGVDLTSWLTEGTHFSFEVPKTVIEDNGPPASGTTAYGMVTVFAMACAGHVQYVNRSQDTLPPAPPLGCFDDTGTELGPNDSVFAYAQVFSYADGRTNANPVISNLTLAGAAVDPVQGITVTHCPAKGKCPTIALDTLVPKSSQEPDPAETIADGKPTNEEIWVDYFLTVGSVDSSALLWDSDPTVTLTSSAVNLTPATAAGTGELWAVVHDNRGGVSWLQVPLNVQ